LDLPFDAIVEDIPTVAYPDIDLGVIWSVIRIQHVDDGLTVGGSGKRKPDRDAILPAITGSEVEALQQAS
jgi:hypothetical protein